MEGKGSCVGDTAQSVALDHRFEVSCEGMFTKEERKYEDFASSAHSIPNKTQCGGERVSVQDWAQDSVKRLKIQQLSRNQPSPSQFRRAQKVEETARG